MVLDTSAVLAVLFNEPAASWTAKQMSAHAGELCMSTVNLAETLVLLRDRQPSQYSELEQLLLTSGIRFVPPDLRQAQLAAAARLRFPLNFGDCFAYALAASEGCSLLAIDSDFRGVDVEVTLPLNA